MWEESGLAMVEVEEVEEEQTWRKTAVAEMEWENDGTRKTK